MNIREHTTVAYPSDSPLQRHGSPSAHTPTIASTWCYLLLSMPLGAVSFAVLLGGLTLGLPLLMVWVGIPVLLLMAVTVGRLAELEADLAERWLGMEAPPRLVIPAGLRGARQLLWLVGQPGFWGNMVFLLLKAPLGLSSFIIALVLPATALGLLLIPLAYPFSTTFGFQLVHISDQWMVDSWPRAFMCSGAGVLLGGLSLVVFGLLAAIWRGLARILLRPFGKAAPQR